MFETIILPILLLIVAGGLGWLAKENPVVYREIFYPASAVLSAAVIFLILFWNNATTNAFFQLSPYLKLESYEAAKTALEQIQPRTGLFFLLFVGFQLWIYFLVFLPKIRSYKNGQAKNNEAEVKSGKGE